MKRLWMALVLLAGCTADAPTPSYLDDPMYLVDVQPSRLAGTWYEVARYPAFFEDGCTHVTAPIPRARMAHWGWSTAAAGMA